MTETAEPVPVAQPELRERILREATRLFAEKGYSATAVREVVEAAGCTKPALYYYFRSKDALFIEAIRAQTERMTRLIETVIVDEVASVYARMHQGIEMYVAHVNASPMGMRLLMRAELQPDEGQPPFDFESLRSHHLGLIRQLLEAGIESGEIRGDVDLDDAGFAIAGMVDQRMQLWLLGTPIPVDLADRLLRIFFRGVAARSG